jgi:hypothetical protein
MSAFIDDLIKEVPAGEDLTAGQLVDIINNKAYSHDSQVDDFFKLNSLSNFGTSAAAVLISSGSFFVAYSEYNGSQVCGFVCTISGQTITQGTGVALTTTSSIANNGSICCNLLSPNSVFVAYGNETATLFGVVITISGQTITQGVATQLTTVAKDPSLIAIVSTTALSATSVFTAYGSNADSGNLYGVVNTISGQTITQGVATQLTTVANILGGYVSTLALSSTSVFTAYGNNTTSNYLYGVVNTISGQTITQGVATQLTTVANALGGAVSCVALSSTSVFTAYQNSTTSYYLYGVVNTISGQTITQGVATQLTTVANILSGYFSTLALSSTSVFTAYANQTNSYYLYGVVNTISGQTITQGVATQLTTVGMNTTQTASLLLSSTSIIVPFTVSGSPYVPYATIVNISGQTIVTKKIRKNTASQLTTVINGINSGWGVSSVALSPTSVFIAYMNNTISTYLYGVVINISGQTITQGVATQLTTVASASNFIAAVALSSTSVFVSYRNDTTSNYLYGVVNTISGQTITQGVATQLTTVANLPAYNSSVVLSATSVFTSYKNNTTSGNLYGVVNTISGQTITQGVATQLTTVANIISSGISSTPLSSTSVFTAYGNQTTSNYLYGVVNTISGQTITQGVATQLNSSPNASSIFSATALSSTSVFTAYSNQTTSAYLYGVVNTISGQTITAKTGLQLTVTPAYAASSIQCAAFNKSSVLVAYVVNSAISTAIIPIYEQTFSAGTTTQITNIPNNSDTLFLNTLSPNSAFIAYQNNTISKYLYGTVLKKPTRSIIQGINQSTVSSGDISRVKVIKTYPNIRTGNLTSWG